MKKILLILLCFGFGIGCNSKSDNKPAENASASGKAVETPSTPEAPKPVAPVKMDSLVTPVGMKKLGAAQGDLDKDGKDEMVAVFDTKKQTEFGTERQVQIFKQDGSAWKLWHTSIGAVLPSEHGGVMGDPFEEITIENGVIVIAHFGGSREKWHYTHRYRLQGGKFQLIGATNSSGEPCVGFETYDYNLSTGKVEVDKGTESCDEKTGEEKKSTSAKSSFMAKLSKPVLMDGFEPGGNEVKIPNKTDESFYY